MDRTQLQKLSRHFESIETIDWIKLWWIVGFILAIWVGLVSMLPPEIYKPVAIVLAALQSGFLFAARGARFIKDRTEMPPQDGKP
jgi:hypothetical protein